MDDITALKTKPRLPVVQMPDPLSHFDGDHWGVRLCALALWALRSIGIAAVLYILHTLLK